ncbi:hypothetical protein [Streptomyces sp. S1]|uniref:hypothetical protein n=1 Tax=Streptomyces sp. S1 TaxID=718288 RepID=UPI003D75D442
MASNYGLGPDYDIALGAAPSDLSAAAVTGLRISMVNVKSVDVVVVKGAGTAADDPTITLRHHTAATGGTSADLATITEYFLRSEATLDNDEPWTKVTQAAAATIVDPGGAGTSAESQQIVVFSVKPTDLPETSNYISVNIGDVGANAQLGTVLFIIHKHDKSEPTAFPIPLR